MVSFGLKTYCLIIYMIFVKQINNFAENNFQDKKYFKENSIVFKDDNKKNVNLCGNSVSKSQKLHLLYQYYSAIYIRQFLN